MSDRWVLGFVAIGCVVLVSGCANSLRSAELRAMMAEQTGVTIEQMYGWDGIDPVDEPESWLRLSASAAEHSSKVERHWMGLVRTGNSGAVGDAALVLEIGRTRELHEQGLEIAQSGVFGELDDAARKERLGAFIVRVVEPSQALRRRGMGLLVERMAAMSVGGERLDIYLAGADRVERELATERLAIRDELMGFFVEAVRTGMSMGSSELGGPTLTASESK